MLVDRDRRHGRATGSAIDLNFQWKVFQVPWLPDQKIGDFEISSFNVSQIDENISRMRAAAQTGRRPFESDRWVEAGLYKKLTYKNRLLMSDTRAEIMEHKILLKQEGKVLLHGLGLGVALMMLLSRPKVKHVTVVEKEAPIINMVVPTFIGMYDAKRFTVVHGDAFTWKARGEWDFVWHDIWSEISLDNLDSMEKLRKRFSKKAKKQGFWSRDYLMQLKRRER